MIIKEAAERLIEKFIEMVHRIKQCKVRSGKTELKFSTTIRTMLYEVSNLYKYTAEQSAYLTSEIL